MEGGPVLPGNRVLVWSFLAFWLEVMLFARRALGVNPKP